MKDFAQGLGWGFLLGAAAFAMLLTQVGVVNEYHKAKDKCEKNLPRNQVCVMKLVPQGE